MTLFLSIMLMLSFMFMFLNHPLSFGMILLLQTMLISLISGLMNYNYWFSYILFLIMVGGMLILFIYMTSIASNEKFKFSIKLSFLYMAMIIFMMMMFMIDLYFTNFPMMTYDTIMQNSMLSNKFSMNKYMNFPSNMIMYMIIIYLFISLIMVVKITNIQYGPLRQKF
uniref:NADH-ubiquinone oxidoreductase chain 6 n=1 Tax=Orsodacne cerasi TaxID=558334 RepID=A0A343C1S8_9CUCU|nr:NADH dehydrogenase subunit 6 [Orsodacne cerasi]